MRILVVEDEPDLAAFIAAALAAEGHAPTVAHDGPTGEHYALADRADLMILDVALPGRDGFAILESVRGHTAELPIIMLTVRHELPDRVRGLDLGANDYLGKPFSLEELMARVRAQLRTTRQPHAARLRVGPLSADLRTRRVHHHGGEVPLTPREYGLLVYFLRHPDQVLSRQQLLQAVWGLDFDPGTKVVEVYIGYLRRKLAARGHSPPIENVRGVGYRLRVLRG